ncbi:hypothetical protein TRSC58_07346 [Trypanosoma rangeli SC58]|uniref:Uncharacterized protein n=1 Tax=Trypanosoma rangeli SC58 TaxID=429131 RepID=A0A061IRN4_TRYRA|nr:hypothetical protein TRSC58_07346 [Trypanosoma rangeli SC58]
MWATYVVAYLLLWCLWVGLFPHRASWRRPHDSHIALLSSCLFSFIGLFDFFFHGDVFFCCCVCVCLQGSVKFRCHPPHT